MSFDASLASKSIDISLEQLKYFLDEYPSNHQQIIDCFMSQILLNNKKNLFLSKMTEKDTGLIEKIGSVLNNCKMHSFVLEKFLTYFHNESSKKIEDNLDIFRRNFFSSFFVDFITESNLEIIIKDIFEHSSNHLLETHINKLLKVPLIFSNYSQHFSQKMSSEHFYKILLIKIESINSFQNNNSLILHFINKLTFNGLIGNVSRLFYFVKKNRYIF